MCIMLGWDILLIWIGLGELDFLTMLCKVGLYWKIYNIEYIDIMLGIGNNYNFLESS